MNKTEFIAAVAEKAEISKKDAEKAVKAFTDVVSEELVNGGKIQLVGFGTFEVSERPAREGRNPRTGETMTIAASKTPKFKPGKALKDCGLGARDTLRLEASMPLYGHEMNDEITPKMAGLPCKLTGKDFIGRDALVALGAPKMKRIGMKVVGRGIVREHCDLYTMDGEKIGWASSGTFAPYIGCGVAMGYIPAQDIEIGKHLNADVRGRMVELEIVPMPFYKLER